MRLILIALFIALPYFSFSQGFTIKIGPIELPTDKIPDFVDLPLRVESFQLKKDVPDPTPKTYILQIGEEEHSFLTNGQYNQIRFTHDIKGLVAYILDEKRNVAAKPFILRRRN
jgi:hypothetical protein